MKKDQIPIDGRVRYSPPVPKVVHKCQPHRNCQDARVGMVWQCQCGKHWVFTLKGLRTRWQPEKRFARMCRKWKQKR